MRSINSTEDLYEMLDRYTEGVDWDGFYTRRDRPTPFLKYNKLPDKCVVDFLGTHNVRNACEFGCGEGRNAIFLAKNGVAVEACDVSETAIENARRIAGEAGVEKAVFRAENIFAADFSGKRFDLVVDSGVFHHLAPHRRLQYRDIVSGILAEGGHFILLCFAAGGNGAEEVDDYEFYKRKQTGAAFTEERLRDFWGRCFRVVELRRGVNIVDPQMWESDMLTVCVFEKSQEPAQA